jgi:hypothetical protein
VETLFAAIAAVGILGEIVAAGCLCWLAKRPKGDELVRHGAQSRGTSTLEEPQAPVYHLDSQGGGATGRSASESTSSGTLGSLDPVGVSAA